MNGAASVLCSPTCSFSTPKCRSLRGYCSPRAPFITSAIGQEVHIEGVSPGKPHASAEELLPAEDEEGTDITE